MPLEDLDLEFEDEDELKKKKAEAVHVDLDLEFGAAPEKPAPVAPSPQVEKVASATAQPAQPKTPAPAPVAEAKTEDVQPGSASVKKLDEVRAKMAQAKAQVAKPNVAASRLSVAGANALEMAPATEDMNLAQLVQLVEDTKFEASVQVAVAQEKSVFMAEMLSDAKLLQHQVQQLIVRMNTKHPDLKPELMAVQKALADFLAKKRK